jgi:hypothetical protein
VIAVFSDTKAPPARETDGDGAPIFTPEFPKADPYQFRNAKLYVGRQLVLGATLTLRLAPIGWGELGP